MWLWVGGFSTLPTEPPTSRRTWRSVVSTRQFRVGVYTRPGHPSNPNAGATVRRRRRFRPHRVHSRVGGAVRGRVDGTRGLFWSRRTEGPTPHDLTPVVG